MKKSEAEVFAQTLLDEIKNPSDIQKLYADMDKIIEDLSPVMEFLSSKDRQHRRIFYLESERKWFDMYGWTMAKTLMLLGLLVGFVFFLGGGRVEVSYLVYFIFGASAYYLLLYVTSIGRFRKNKKKIAEILADYKGEIKSILQDIIKKHNLPADRYNVN